MMALNSVRAGVVLILMATAGYAAAAEPSGKAIAVVQSANIDGATGLKVLMAEMPVFSGDRIDTGPVGEAQIRFRDDTKLVVGPNSSMIIDAFVFNDDDSAREISINAVRGAFRFITGNSPKDVYTITTPTATIGVRGTEFDVDIEPGGTTRVANFEGTTRICRRQPDGTIRDPQRDCQEARDPCTLSVIRVNQPGVVQYSNTDIAFRNRQLRYYFRYVRDQSALQADFQVDTEECSKIPPVPTTPEPPTPPGPIPEPPPPLPSPDPPTLPPPPTPDPPTIPAGRHDSRPVDNSRSVFH